MIDDDLWWWWFTCHTWCFFLQIITYRRGSIHYSRRWLIGIQAIIFVWWLTCHWLNRDQNQPSLSHHHKQIWVNCITNLNCCAMNGDDFPIKNHDSRVRENRLRSWWNWPRQMAIIPLLFVLEIHIVPSMAAPLKHRDEDLSVAVDRHDRPPENRRCEATKKRRKLICNQWENIVNNG